MLCMHFLATTFWDDYCLIIQLLTIEDNSCMMANMKHGIQDKIDAKLIDNKDCPRKEDKHVIMVKVKDSGKLSLQEPIDHPGTRQE